MNFYPPHGASKIGNRGKIYENLILKKNQLSVSIVTYLCFIMEVNYINNHFEKKIKLYDQFLPLHGPSKIVNLGKNLQIFKMLRIRNF